MEIREYLRILRSTWWVVLVCVLMGAGLALGYSLVGSEEYRACSRLFVTTEGGASVGEAYQNNLFSQGRVGSYAELATSAQVAQRAVDEMGVAMTAQELRSRVTAAPIPNTVLLNVCVTDESAATARDLTDGVALQLTQVVQELETSSRGGSPAAAADIVDQAGLPSAPVGTSRVVLVGLGAAAGLALGIVLAVLVGLLDRSVRDRRRVADLAQGAVLGGLPRDPERPDQRVAPLGEDARLGEPLRTLRTNLRFVGGSEARVLAVTSPGRGEGRTTVAVDLAHVLAEAGHRVLLVGGDLRDDALALRLGHQGEAGLSTVLAGELGPDAAIVGDEAGFDVLPSGPLPPNPAELLGSDAAVALVAELRARYRYVVVDTPPLLEVSDGVVVGALADDVLVVARLGRTSRDALRRGLTALGTVGARVLGTVVTFEGDTRRSGRRSRAAAPAEPSATPDDQALVSSPRHGS